MSEPGSTNPIVFNYIYMTGVLERFSVIAKGMNGIWYPSALTLCMAASYAARYAASPSGVLKADV